MKEVIQINDWKFKFRRKNKKGYYDVIKRRDGTYFCSCPSHRYNKEECKHINLLKAYFGEANAIEQGKNVSVDTEWLMV